MKWALLILSLIAARASAQQVPSMLAAVPQLATHSVSLSCTQSTSSGVTGNNFYRSSVGGGPYTRLNSTPTSTCAYVDKAVTVGLTYYYVATAVSSSGAESAYSKEVSATIPGVPSSLYVLAVSSNPSRSSAVPLQGVTLKGSEYIFTAPAAQPANSAPSGIASVGYWIDNTVSTTSPAHLESATPYDFAGTASSGAAIAWNTLAVADGTHTLTQRVRQTSGATEVDTVTFVVQNGTALPVVSVSVSPPSVLLVAGDVRQFIATVTGTSNATVAWNVTCGSISSTGLYTAPATAGTCAVKATSTFDATKYASATVTVTLPPLAVTCDLGATVTGLRPGDAYTVSVASLGRTASASCMK